MTTSLRATKEGERISRMLAAAVNAVEPGEAVERAVTRIGNDLVIEGNVFSLPEYERIFVVGIGKAASSMSTAIAKILGDCLHEGVILVKDGYGPKKDERRADKRFLTLEAGHPIPDMRGVKGAQEITRLITSAGVKDLVLCLISGGGSALLTSPAEGIPLENLQELTSLLLACGATIQEINTIRKHVETLKGGGLARLVYPATLVSLILSDVIGDPLDVIASGLTVPDRTTFEDAWNVLAKYALISRTPSPIINHIVRGKEGEFPDTPKIGDPIFGKVHNILVGNNLMATQALENAAITEGTMPIAISTHLRGEASMVGRSLAALAKQFARQRMQGNPSVCLICGGETTVTVRGNGLGGRNQELALSAVEELGGIDGVVLVALATDGSDGPTDAAGAVATGNTLQRAKRLGLDPALFLQRNDAYHFFEPLGDLLKPGPTMTNVNDLTIIYIE